MKNNEIQLPQYYSKIALIVLPILTFSMRLFLLVLLQFGRFLLYGRWTTKF